MGLLCMSHTVFLLLLQNTLCLRFLWLSCAFGKSLVGCCLGIFDHMSLDIHIHPKILEIFSHYFLDWVICPFLILSFFFESYKVLRWVLTFIAFMKKKMCSIGSWWMRQVVHKEWQRQQQHFPINHGAMAKVRMWVAGDVISSALHSYDSQRKLKLKIVHNALNK